MMNLKKLPNAIQFALFVGAASLVSGNALAQDQDEGEDAQQEEETSATTLDRIEVTGSRLKRADIEGAVPVIVIDREQIDASGDVTVADVLRDSTFASFGNLRPQSGSSAQSVANISLRGLGGGRTLVLIDGRRAPVAPNFAAGGTDVNAIPLAAVERIEILSDGASAIYGSDAIGGVVNIILRKDFNGVELRYGIQQTEVKGADQENASVVFGVSGDRGRLIGGAGMSDREIVFVRDQIGYEMGTSVFGNNVYDPVDSDGPGPDTAAGLFAVPGYACDDQGFRFTGNGLCAYDFNLVAANQASIQNKSIFLMGDYQINDDWSVYSNATVTQTESFGRYAPTPGFFGVSDGTPQDVNYGVMLRNDPAFIATGNFCPADPTTGVPDPTCVGATTDGGRTYFAHRFAAGGNRDDTVYGRNNDFLIGFEGRLTDTVGIDFGLRRTNYIVNTRGNGYVVAPLASAAAENGSYDIADPYSNPPEVLKGFTATISRVSEYSSDEYYGMVNFDLFEMAGGISNAVVGAEFRDIEYVDQYDSLSEAGVVLGSAGNSAGGDRTVGSAYFEWLFPIATSFDFTVAGRYDKYSDYGADFSPKVALRWQPLDNLTFRASYGQGFKAPSLDIITQAPAFSAQPVNDVQTCVALGEAPDCQVQVNSTVVANPGLSSEQSDQYSLGAVWDATDWLDMSLDYYHIEIEDRIAFFSAQDIINKAADPGTFGAIPPGLGLTRNPTTGRVTEVISGYGNEGALETDGLDFRANTDFDLGAWGRLQNRLQVSHTLNYEVTDAAGTTEQIDLLGAPATRAFLGNYWTMGDFQVYFGSNYISSNGDGAVGGYTTNDAQVSWEAPWDATIAVGATNIGDRYPQLVDFDGRSFNYGLYDAYGRTTYFRYTQRF